jgi:hypothetical protein
VLRSPLFDLSNYSDPYLSYYRWYYNAGGTGGTPNDSFTVSISNGIDTVLLDRANADTLRSAWRYKNFRVTDFIPPSSAMRIFFTATDVAPGHLVEAALDVFQVVDSGAIPSTVTELQTGNFRIYPNPFSVSLVVERNSSATATLLMYDVTGRLLKEQVLTERKNTISMDGLTQGVYIAKVFENGRGLGDKKLIKVD